MGRRCRVLCYNHCLSGWRYRLGVRTEDSQSSNPGSIPGSATTFRVRNLFCEHIADTKQVLASNALKVTWNARATCFKMCFLRQPTARFCWYRSPDFLPEKIMNCRGCGVDIDPSEEQVNTTVDQILETSLHDAQKKGGVCPLCGHSKEVPYSHRKTVQFGLLLACLLVSTAVGIGVQRSRHTQRAAVAEEAVGRMATNAD